MTTGWGCVGTVVGVALGTAVGVAVGVSVGKIGQLCGLHCSSVGSVNLHSWITVDRNEWCCNKQS